MGPKAQGRMETGPHIHDWTHSLVVCTQLLMEGRRRNHRVLRLTCWADDALMDRITSTTQSSGLERNRAAHWRRDRDAGHVEAAQGSFELEATIFL
jgi:hypothetical protein